MYDIRLATKEDLLPYEDYLTGFGSEIDDSWVINNNTVVTSNNNSSIFYIYRDGRYDGFMDKNSPIGKAIKQFELQQSLIKQGLDSNKAKDAASIISRI